MAESMRFLIFDWKGASGQESVGVPACMSFDLAFVLCVLTTWGMACLHAPAVQGSYARNSSGLRACLRAPTHRRAPRPYKSRVHKRPTCLRPSTYTRETAKAAAEVSSLSARPSAQEAVARASSGPKLDALPYFHQDQRVALRSQAPSVKRNALQEWLGTEEATTWHKRRRAIFGTGEETLALALEE